MQRARLMAPAAALALTLVSGGCSFQLGSILDHGGDVDRAEVTGSIPKTAAQPVSETVPEQDVALRAAARDLLARNQASASMPWENPRTGARGTVTPIAKAYSQVGGATCRDFLASYIRDGSEAWLQGEACHSALTGWVVRSLKPWTSS